MRPSRIQRAAIAVVVVLCVLALAIAVLGLLLDLYR
jgi:hypothetical protein